MTPSRNPEIIAGAFAVWLVTAAMAFTFEDRPALKPRQVGEPHRGLHPLKTLPGGEWFAGMSAKGVLLWDGADLSQPPRRFAGRGQDFAVHPDFAQAATTRIEIGAQVWISDSESPLVTLGNHTNGVWSVAYTASGEQLVVTDGKGQVHFYSTVDWQRTGIVTVDTVDAADSNYQRILRLQSSPRQHWVAGISKVGLRTQETRGSLVVLDTDQHQLAQHFVDKVVDMRQPEFTADGSRLVVLGRGWEGPLSGRVILNIYDTTTWEMNSLWLPRGNMIELALSPDGTLAAMSGINDEWMFVDGEKRQTWRELIQLVDLDNGEIRGEIPGQWGSLAFTADGKGLLAQTSGYLMLFDLENVLTMPAAAPE